MIVLPAFFSRADSTPQARWPRDPKNVVGRDGLPIANPDADPSAFLMTQCNVAIEADEATFIDHSQSEYWTALNYDIINRMYPERVTKR